MRELGRNLHASVRHAVERIEKSDVLTEPGEYQEVRDGERPGGGTNGQRLAPLLDAAGAIQTPQDVIE